ncbi:MAG: hypothetical protein QOF51_1866 [Chloroflexota bacterium]|jgi:hypothetical protein|nr:hypothetical protein [Chloroflexota bacterium]
MSSTCGLTHALIPHVIARLVQPRGMALAVDWTMFDTTLPRGQRMRYRVLRIAIRPPGRALPRIAYERDGSDHQTGSQDQAEEAARRAVIEVLPAGVRTVVLADGSHLLHQLGMRERAAQYVWLGDYPMHRTLWEGAGLALSPLPHLRPATVKSGRRLVPAHQLD